MPDIIANPTTANRPIGTTPRLYKMIPAMTPIKNATLTLVPSAAQNPNVIMLITTDVAMSVDSSMGMRMTGMVLTFCLYGCF